ncbi:hypothetical protein ACLKA7_003258 [Drosophila subpalustris]
MSASSKQIVEAELIEKENGAGALEPKQSPKEQRKLKRKHLIVVDNEDGGQRDADSQVLTPVEKAKFSMPPPPPPPTPVQAPAPSRSTSAAAAAIETEDDEANSEKWEDPCAPPPPPPLPINKLSTSQNYVKLTAIKLKDALEEAITKMETNKREQQKQRSTFDSVVVLDELKADAVKMSPICLNNRDCSQAMILHPKCNKPEAIRKLEREIKVGNLLQRQATNVIISKEAIPLPSTAHEDEGQGLMALQVLSARASTPYTQPSSQLSCTAVSCDLHLSPPPLAKGVGKKPLSGPQQATHKRSISATTTGSLRLPKLRNTQSAIPLPTTKSMEPLQKYTRQHLLDIRHSMLHALMHRSKESLAFSMPRIATCDDIELEARLRRMNLWRSADAIARNAHSYKPRSSTNNANGSNECMPAFYKNKTKQQQLISDDSIIQSQPPQPQQEFQPD